MAWAYHPEERASIFSAQLSQVASRAVQEDLEKAQVGLEGEAALSISKMNKGNHRLASSHSPSLRNPDAHMLPVIRRPALRELIVSVSNCPPYRFCRSPSSRRRRAATGPTPRMACAGRRSPFSAWA